MRREWKHLSDSEFDDWIKSGADSHSEPLWEGAWEAMESKLEEKKERKIIPFWWRSAAAILIFAFIGGYFYLKTDSESDLAKNTGVLKNNLEKFESKSKIETQEKVGKEVFGKDNITFDGNTELDIVKGSGRGNLKPVKNSQQSFIPKEILNSDSNSQSGKEKFEEQVLENTGKNEIAQNETKNIPLMDSLNSKEVFSGTETAIKYDSEILTKDESAENLDSVITISDEQYVEIQQNSKRTRFSRWAINFGASPDYSSVIMGQSEPIGYNLQIGLSYNITPDLQIRTAVIRSLKLYEAYAEDYAWPAKWGIPSSPLTEVVASCKMLDFPVSLTYFPFRKNKNAYYVSLGVTNYYMLKEKYEYHYENDNDPNLKWKNWEGSTGFAANSVANVSIGLQRKISSKISVQVEPFIKLPLRNIGFGNVRLYSAGVFFNIIPTNIFKRATKIN